MKRKLISLLLLLILVSMLCGCEFINVPRPEIKKGNFNISVTYEHKGEIKTLSGVYVCQYTGIEWTIEGNYFRSWKGYFKSGIDDEIMDICTTDDGGVITLIFTLYPEYFMGDPEFADHTPNVGLSLIYYSFREKDHVVYDAIYDDAELIESHGVKIIDLEFDEPIENTFRPFTQNTNT